MKNLTKTILFIFLSGFALTAGAVWSDPISTAPGSNASTPINTSPTAQLKTGGISVGSLIVSGGATLGDTVLGCDITTDGLIRFNSGKLEICSDENQLESINVSSSQPLFPSICSAGEVAVYNTTTSLWECGAAPQPLPECADGQLMSYNTAGSTWECTDGTNSKFISGTDPSYAVNLTGKVGIGTLVPEAYLHINTGADAASTSEDHHLTLGTTTGQNMAIDDDGIISRDNGVMSPLYLQTDGGAFSVHDAMAEQYKFRITDDGRVGIGEADPESENGKLIIKNNEHIGPDGWPVSIVFENNNHNAIWNPNDSVIWNGSGWTPTGGGNYFGMHSDGTFYWGNEINGTHESYPMQLNSDTGDVVKNGTLAADFLVLRGRRLYFGDSTQSLRGDNGEYIDYYSNHDTVSQIILRDKEYTTYGHVHGSGNGANFGLLDGDGNWMYLAVKDAYTALRVNNSEKMRIENTGDVGIGVMYPAYRLDVADTVNGNYMVYFRNSNTSADADGVRLTMSVPGTLVYDDHFVSFRDNAGNLHGSIGGRYNGTQVLYWTASDRRLKENIESLNVDYAKDILMKARPVTYNWIEDGRADIGYIAQELKEAFPLAVVGEEDKFEITENEDGKKSKVPVYMTVADDKMVPLIHSALVGNIAEAMKLERQIEEEEALIKDLNYKLGQQQKILDDIAKKLN